jgi:LPXTG-site transpeptidase (sortase) family protein
MYPHGIIYHADSDNSHGDVFLRAPRRVRIAYGFFRGIGAGLIGFVVIAFLFTFWPVISSEFTYSVNANVVDTRPDPVLKLEQETLIDVEAQEKSTNLAESIAAVQKEAEELGVDSHFSIVVPKINATSNIIANVDTSNELKNGVAHAAGTFFPGQDKTIFLFSHSTNSALNVAQYRAVFYLLRKLENGDKVIIFFADKKYEYEVVDKKTVGASDVEWMTRDFGEERLILQTCTPPGTDWQRLLVFAKRVN